MLIRIFPQDKLPMPRTSGYDLVCAALATRVLVRPPEHYALPKDQPPSGTGSGN